VGKRQQLWWSDTAPLRGTPNWAPRVLSPCPPCVKFSLISALGKWAWLFVGSVQRWTVTQTRVWVGGKETFHLMQRDDILEERAGPSRLGRFRSLWRFYPCPLFFSPWKGGQVEWSRALNTRLRKCAISRPCTQAAPSCLSFHGAGLDSQPLYPPSAASWPPMMPVPPPRNRRCC
jgi:hypothetical protein